ncbi:uncharacterized protein LOC112573113 isoform X3 [Pomacea canaliculata]|uniref:uncharacterized protein LOC112573113 isoform X3 n=1 Tax=Pomacea canaliculata TaxID=400727 RepID=UPI000D731C8E|nr:uncharacterized protein LOC112573113 isoform X3 [Pomacea canaliculata]
MKTMNNRKRVSFGSKGSMVETWIIEDFPTPRSSKEEEFFSSLVTSKSDSGLHSSSTGSPDSLSPYRDSCNRVLVLHDPQGQGLGSPLDVPNNAIFVTDHVTGWPLKRSPSLESRDNPFQPDGDLRKEVEELLKRATIVRDKFYLTEDEKSRQQELLARGDYSPVTKEHTTVDGVLTSGGPDTSPRAVHERIAPPTTTTTTQAAAASPPPHPRENGKATGPDEVAGPETSPDGVRVDVGGSPTADGPRGAGNTDSSGEQQEKDKAKRRPKCCVVM